MENTSQKLVAASYKRKNRKRYIVEFDHVEVFLCSFYVETTTRKIHKLLKPNIISLWFTDLRKPVSTFRNVNLNEADHVTKSDLNSELKMAATIMTWFSRGIPLGIGQSRCKWNILNTPIKTCIANLSIGDKDNCCQRSSFNHSVSIGPGSLLCSPRHDFKQYWMWPSLRSERKSSKRVRFELDYVTMCMLTMLEHFEI